MDSGLQLCALVSAYCRPDHLRECLTSLEKCIGSRNLDVVVTIDAPATNAVKSANSECFDVVRERWEFKSIEIVSTKINTGGEIIKRTASELLQTKDTLIMFEEDNRFSPDFLEYMTWCFERYWNDAKVCSVSGWSPPDPLHQDSDAVTRYSGYCAWGVGLWAHKMNGIIIPRQQQYLYVNQSFNDRAQLRSYFKKADHLKRALLNFLWRKGEAGDRYIDLYFYNRNLESIFPYYSRVRNVGHDGSGENCSVSQTHLSQDISKITFADYNEILDRENFSKRVFRHYKLPLWKNLMLALMVELIFILKLLNYSGRPS